MAIERTNSFHLLLSDDELKLLKLLAERDGLNASDYLRMLIRMMPSTNAPNIAQATRLGAVLGSLSQAGKVDLAKVFEAHTDAVKAATADVEETKKKKAK
jgi:hypothetical protein